MIILNSQSPQLAVRSKLANHVNNIFLFYYSFYLIILLQGYEGQFKYQNGRCFFCGTFPKNNQYFYHSNKNSEGGQYRHMNKFQAYGNNHPLHPPPVPADLADILNTAKYFIIKSGNLDNIDVARKLSIWATTLTNQVIFLFMFIYLLHFF